jgi:hypothetical protein
VVESNSMKINVAILSEGTHLVVFTQLQQHFEAFHRGNAASEADKHSHGGFR